MIEDALRREAAKRDALSFGCIFFVLAWAFLMCITQPRPWTAEAVVLGIAMTIDLRLWARARRFWLR